MRLIDRDRLACSRLPRVGERAIEVTGQLSREIVGGIGAGFTPTVLNRALLDEVRSVSGPESFAAARRCAAVEGLPIGISSGAVLHAMLDLAVRDENEGKLIVGIAASFAARYLSTPLFAGI
jgi:cysteine synthase A